MKNIKYKVQFLSWWHCGSGQASGADLDELVIKDRDGLPFIPGRTIKGLLRDACDELAEYGNLSKDSITTVFGYEQENNKDSEKSHDEVYYDKAAQGCAFFSNAVLPDAERNGILGDGSKEEKLANLLYYSVSSTAIDENGIAKDHSLRKIQVTVPCTLEGEIRNVPDDAERWLASAMSLVKRLGTCRNHGLGRCQMTVAEVSEKKQQSNASAQIGADGIAGVIHFKCTLLSDVVLSESSATEGRHRGLDIIPGGNFLGIAASAIYGAADERSRTIFHSGAVRFGDAHPAFKQPDGKLTRTLRIPADCYYPKLNKIYDECYLSHLIEKDSEDLKEMQLKQARSGLYAFSAQTAQEVKVDKTYAIKTAYDTKNRKSKDEQIFGYECIHKGSVYLFDVSIDQRAAQYRPDIVGALSGDRHIGRSRSAQYGWVKIEVIQGAAISGTASSAATSNEESGNGGEVLVYADGRLVFFDDEGMPTLRPKAIDLGLAGEIDWTRSQVRSFHYAPWNNKRQAYDSERCGIEKGSVFVVKPLEPGDCKPAAAKSGNGHVGVYQNEGFGDVIYNPYFLTAAGPDGKSTLKYLKAKEGIEKTGAVGSKTPDTPLLLYLKTQQKAKAYEWSIYDAVDKFVEDNVQKFRGAAFASQWGTIRGIAMASKPEKVRANIDKYLDHGVARGKWEDRGRLACFDRFLDNYTNNPEIVQEAVINLASAMAKKLRDE